MKRVTNMARGSCLMTSMTEAQVDYLDQKFAVFTQYGWVVPEWIKVLRAEVQINTIIRNAQPRPAVN